MSKLKPCPLCGSNVGIYWGACHNIQCDSCNIGFDGGGGMSKDDLILRWNNNGSLPDSSDGEWIVINETNLPPLELPVRIWNDDGWSPDYTKECIGRRSQTNDDGDWYWCELNMTNTSLNDVTHFAYQVPPKEASK